MRVEDEMRRGTEWQRMEDKGADMDLKHTSTQPTNCLRQQQKLAEVKIEDFEAQREKVSFK